MALKGGKLTDAEKATIQQFAETGGLDVMPVVAGTLNRSEAIVLEYVATLDNVKTAPAPPAQTSSKPHVALQNGVQIPATNSEAGVAIMTRTASEMSDHRRPLRQKGQPSHIAPCKRPVSAGTTPEELASQIAVLQSQLERMTDDAADNQNG